MVVGDDVWEKCRLPSGFCKPATWRGIPRLWTNKSFDGFQTNSLQKISHFHNCDKPQKACTGKLIESASQKLLNLTEIWSEQLWICTVMRKGKGGMRSLDNCWLLLFQFGSPWACLVQIPSDIQRHILSCDNEMGRPCWKIVKFRETFMIMKMVGNKIKLVKS